MSECIRCHSVETPDPAGYCPACVVHSRVEVVTGLRRLSQYLAAWAAFDEWCTSGGSDAALGQTAA
jgi:hypothetical protein